MKYAQNTTVSVSKSKAELEAIVSRYGADQFVSGWQEDKALIEFRIQNRRIRFILNFPSKDSNEFWVTPGGRRRRDPADALKAWEQSCRQGWRALVLVVKAKLEAVESGITTFEAEFLANIVLPNNQTVGQWIQPQIAQSYETRQLPALLPGITH